MDGPGGTGAEAPKIHPFFSAPKNNASVTSLSVSTRPVTPDPSCSPGSERAAEQPVVAATTSIDEIEPAQGREKRRKTESAAEAKEPAKRGRPKGTGKVRVATGSNTITHGGQEDEGATGDPRDVNASIDLPEATHSEARSIVEQSPLPHASTSNVLLAPTTSLNTNGQAQEMKPKKILQFNPKTGTIGSPPKPKAETIDQVPSKPKPLGRPKRAKKATSLIVCIQYGIDEAMRIRVGEKIEEVYSGIPYVSARNTASNNSQSSTQQIAPPASSQETPKKRASRKSNTPKNAKSAHPFFASMSKSTLDTPTDVKEKSKSPVKRQSIFTSTPCSPKHLLQQPAKFNIPQFGMKSGVFKFPGAQLAAWPWKGMLHIYGDGRDINSVSSHESSPDFANTRKNKGRQIEFITEESVLSRFQSQLRLETLAEELKTLNTEDFLPTPPTLRTPGRYFESGKNLQARIQPELRTLMLGNQARTHPIILNGFKSLTSCLPAFDRSTCESIAWTQKYSPKNANQVLQSGKEAELLRDWLQTLKVQTIDTGASDSNAVDPKTAPTKKKKRKKLDDFVVSSDEEDTFMDELANDDDSSLLPNGTHGSLKRTVVRSGSSKDARLTNTVLLSGPHGCGKTATVYAIAKELDFEIFEISPGARRNGKDIIEKIGDMTRNHQVSHKQDIQKPEDAIDEDDVARDIECGKQGMMTAFFRPKADIKPKLVGKKPTPVPTVSVVEKPTKKLSNKSQKQSLILLEEVDILYEEDKHFWTTVISLMAQSKRPFVMTCNNENLVPIQNLNLHGIFRFSAAPKDRTIDHLLLIAANEGHALRREAVESLYESRGCDLRASITELNYWCQIGVADPRGGFGWFYPKWPAGSDVDEAGDKIRVVSSNTYREGMGWLGRDALGTPSTSSSVEEEVVKQAWENWSLDEYDYTIAVKGQEDCMAAEDVQLSRSERLVRLEAVDTFCESLSIADITSCGVFSCLDEVILDPTLPALPSKVKDDFVIGQQLLEAPLQIQYSSVAFDIATSTRNLARSQLPQALVSCLSGYGLSDEDVANRAIRRSFQQQTLSKAMITRHDFSSAFDPIAVSKKSLVQYSGHLDTSVFDRTMSMIALDVAPYVRCIVAYDQYLQAERLLRSNLLSEGGKPKKRVRATRSAYSALEGGPRASTRREKYFSADLNPHLVLLTGGKDWESLVCGALAVTEEQRSPPSSTASGDDMDTLTG